MLVERGLEAILIFLCLAYEEKVPKWLIGHWPAGWPPLTLGEDEIKVIWWAVLVAIWVMVSLLMRGVWRAAPLMLRRDHFPQAILRGVWVERIDNDRPWGLACIDYDWREDQWIYKGVAFEADLSLKASWNTRGIAIAKTPDGWTWQTTGEGKMLDQKPNGTIAENTRFDIAVWLDFTKDARKYVVHAKAVDLNFSPAPAGAVTPRDKLFSLTLKHTTHPNSVIEAVRTMSLAEREQLFEPLGRPITRAKPP